MLASFWLVSHSVSKLLIILYFLFHGLHFATTLRVLNPVLCFHVILFNYRAKEVRHVDPACKCHQSNIVPDSIFSVNIAQLVTNRVCLFFVLLYFTCILSGDILGSFYSKRQGAQFYHCYINWLGETLNYNGLRQTGLNSFK